MIRAWGVAGVLLLAACSSGNSDDGGKAAVKPSDETLAALVSQTDDLSAVSATLGDTGLAQVFEGVAPYTLLAPRDAAFDSLGEAGKVLRSPEQRPAMIAVLRDHIIPGYLMPEDIAKAIAREGDGKVTMKTMGGHTLTFSGREGAITATGEDGTSAHFAGEPLLGGNGVAIPLDGLTVKIDGAGAS